MGDLVEYHCARSVAEIAMDDGKVNVLSPSMQLELAEALDQAERDESAVVLKGRPGVFSAGFDLDVLKAGGDDAFSMVRGGFLLTERLLSFPYPVVIACSGHAVAMAVFLVLSADYRVGVSGEFRLRANEVAIGLTMPRAAIAICRERLSPAAFTRAMMLSETFSPTQAVEAGILDLVVEPSDLETRTQQLAVTFRGLDMTAHRNTKLRARHSLLESLRASIEQDDSDLRALADVAR